MNKLNLTNEELVLKLRDPKFYLENFCKIKTKGKGLAPFIFNEAQKDIANALKKFSRIIILKARQLGFSTAITGLFYVDTITTPGTNTALIGYNSDLTSELLDKIKTFIRTTPASIRPTIHYNSKYEISFPALDSKILVLPSTENVGRGYTLHNCLCVSGDTIVFGENGKLKTVKDVFAGDLIYNGKGGKSKVKKIIKKSSDARMLSVDVVGCDDVLKITEDHEVLTRNGWRQAGELSGGDFIAYPYFQMRDRLKEFDLSIYPVKRGSFIKSENIKIDRDFGELCGWFAAEGSVKNGRIMFSINRKESDYLIGLIKKVLDKKIGKIGINRRKDSESMVLSITSQQISQFLIDHFGAGAKNKTINDSVWYWGWEFGYGFLRGLFLGDGYFQECDDRRVILTSISPSLVYQVKKMLVSLRIGLASIHSNETSRYGVRGQRVYTLSLHGPGNYKFRRKLGFRLPVYNNGRFRWIQKNDPGRNYGWKTWVRGRFYYWMKIRSVSRIENEEFVYDIVLDGEPHTFLTHAGVVHNCTELAFWEKAEEKMMALEASVPIDGKLVIESTPDFVGNLYHRMWVSDNEYAKKEYGWWWGYSTEQIETIRRRMNNPIQFAKEYELEFLTSGRAVFDQAVVKKMRKHILKVGDKHPITGDIVEEVDGLRIYRKIKPDDIIVCGADVAEGVTGGDYSTAIFFDRRTGEEVAFYRGLIAPDRFGEKLDKWGREMNNALMAVEINNHGLTTLTILKQKVYPCLYFRPVKIETIAEEYNEKMGWKTTKLTRPLLIDDFAQAVRDGLILLHSKEALDEMTTFIYNSNNDMEPQPGFHDDCIFGAGIAYQGFKIIFDNRSLGQIDISRMFGNQY